MPYADVPAFVGKLGERETVGRFALEALILTAARSGEIRGALWSELDLEAGLRTIPAARMKLGRAHIVPLSPEAAAAFERAKKYKAGVGDFAFPGQDVKKPLSDMTLLSILRNGELTVTVNGFRSASGVGWRSRRTIRPKWQRPRSPTPCRTRSNQPTTGPTSSTNAVFSCGTGHPSVRRHPLHRRRSL